jgi:acetoin:2,6-dichlorophenolindophenol oxidoreductase subunit alpha
MNIHHPTTKAEAWQADSRQRLAWLETMTLIRAYEEKLVELQQHGAPGTCTSVGQEACAVGVVSALEACDRILTNHRSAGHLIARGAEIGRLFAEVLGREDGYCKGRSGSLHISAKDLGVVLTSTIVGGELSMAPGVALAQKMGQGEAGGITAVFFGDGAACEGIFHEALNLAVQWELPLLFVCEDNHWQAFVHRDEAMPAGAIPQWARSHGLPVVSVDGNDVEAVFDAASRAVAGIRETGRPQFLHLETYRQRGHIEPDDQAYVDRAELARWIDNDPIRRLEARLIADRDLVSDDFGARIAARIEEAVAFAQASPWPSPDHLHDFTYA